MKEKNILAVTPPMGWNSWDCYGASVTEGELLANARYMKEHLLQYGWEYVVCDIQWYEPSADSSEYHDFVPLCMDEYSRLIPAEGRFPSAAGGRGFGVIAEQIHEMGLKFGIHIMRGIPRQAVHGNTRIKGSKAGARDIAQRFSVCSWNTDMYGIDGFAIGAQAYYDSIFELYAEWGVDFVKVDDICNTFFSPQNPYSAEYEIEMIRAAIDKCGRNIVLSLSPGPAEVEREKHLSQNANMWRMTGDFWDRWEDLYVMFEKCKIWSPYVKEGCWPDCDMLPLGHIAIRGAEHGMGARYTKFTREEQQTMMTLWCIFRSPLMFGGNLCDNDEWTNSLLTNEEVLRLLGHSYGAAEVARSYGKETVIWKSWDEDGCCYVAVFNNYCLGREIELSLSRVGMEDTEYYIRDLWLKQDLGIAKNSIMIQIPTHGVRLLRLRQKYS